MATAMDSRDTTGVAATNDRAPEATRARERKANAALELRIKYRASWDDVAETIGYPTPRAAMVAVERALERELSEAGSRLALRHMAGKKLDLLLDSVWDQAVDTEDPAQMVALGRARELIADWRKVYGVDAPTELVIHSPSESEIEAFVGKVAKHMTPQLDQDDIFNADYDDDYDIVQGEIVKEAPELEAGQAET